MENEFTQQEWEDIESFAQHFLDCTRWVENRPLASSPDKEGIAKILRSREVARKIVR